MAWLCIISAPDWCSPGSGSVPIASSPTPVRFVDFELDLRTGELRRRGVLQKPQPQPARILTILVSRVGEVATRQELTQQVWGSETFVDYEQGLNFAIRQIRRVLDDNANDPRFLETIPKRGYRFIGALDRPVNESPASGKSVPLAVVHPYEPTAQKGLRRYGQDGSNIQSRVRFASIGSQQSNG